MHNIGQNTKEIIGLTLLLASAPIALLTPVVLPLFAVGNNLIYGITSGEILFIVIFIAILIWWR